VEGGEGGRIDYAAPHREDHITIERAVAPSPLALAAQSELWNAMTCRRALQ